MRHHLASALLGLSLVIAGCGNTQESFVVTAPADVAGTSSGLPIPSTLSQQAFEKQLYPFLNEREYVALGWQKDKTIRDTGPYINGKYYGTHPAVRIYYSPEIMTWLTGGKVGEIPDGAMLVKEMYPPPAARYVGKVDKSVPTEWTVMVRDKNGAHDGWFWSYYSSNPKDSNPPVPQAVDNDDYPFNYPNSGFGLYCVRCHGSAETALTFSSTDNIEGFPGQPQVYEVDNSWITDVTEEPEPHPNDDNHVDAIPRAIAQAMADGTVDQEFLDYFKQFPEQNRFQIQGLPSVTTDHVVAKAHRDFYTSDQCMSCHSGDNTNFGPNMIKDGVDFSPWGEWAWSMMGLAGRDPIFFAQLESEIALHADKPGGTFTAASLENVCLRCHGVMGQRQFSKDNPGQNFTLEMALSTTDDEAHENYGGLARDGVSCMVCHQITDQSAVPFTEIETGKFLIGSATNGVRKIFGQYDQPAVKPMQDSLALLPVKGDHVKDSLLCASCHTVKLPILDEQGKTIAEKYEQSTFFEWQNSVFNQKGTEFRSCQDCHMPQTFHNETITNVKIANVQDQDFPPADGLAPIDEITVDRRDDFSRHGLAGINVFGLEFFKQFPELLGVRQTSFMTGYNTGITNSIANSLDQASKSARIDILSTALTGSVLESRIKVTSLTGHRFPSGVGFRRMFLQVVVKDASGRTVWSSGRTNGLGVIIDTNGNPLPSESHAVDPATGKQAYQPHYRVIDSQAQVQIYEELNQGTDGKFNTSFLGRAHEVKDNRLMPKGWTFEGPPGMPEEFVEATNPVGDAASDPDFLDGTGSDTIAYRATLPAGVQGPLTLDVELFYQSIPPDYLEDRFSTAKGPAGRRLHYMASRLDVDQTAFKDWKLPITSASRTVTP